MHFEFWRNNQRHAYFFLYLSATINLGVWRHICLSLDFEEGLIILVENAETRIDLRDQEKVVKMFKDFSPTFGSVLRYCCNPKRQTQKRPQFYKVPKARICFLCYSLEIF